MEKYANKTREEFAKENFPELSKHNNVMSAQLTYAVSGFNLDLRFFRFNRYNCKDYSMGSRISIYIAINGNDHKKKLILTSSFTTLF